MLEIPSGVWADATSRRRLLTVAPLLRAAGFGAWVLAPSYAAFAAGFVLWGVAGALESGALEALVYEELDAVGAASRYPEVIGRATALGTVASTAAIGLAAPVLAVGGFAAVGVASVIACLAGTAVAATLPEHRHRPEPDGGRSGWRAGAAILRAGVVEVRSTPGLRGAVVLVAAVASIWGALDEYVPLLAADTRVAEASVPLLFGVVYAGVTVGGLLGGAATRLTHRGLAAALVVAAATLALGALSRVPAGFVLIAVAFCLFQGITVVVDSRLQGAIAGPTRATVTSLAAFGTEVLVLVVFGAYAAGSAVASNATLFACFGAAYVVIAVTLPRDRRSAP